METQEEPRVGDTAPDFTLLEAGAFRVSQNLAYPVLSDSANVTHSPAELE
jgi:hypothetical protein